MLRAISPGGDKAELAEGCQEVLAGILGMFADELSGRAAAVGGGGGDGRGEGGSSYMGARSQGEWQ